MTKEGSVIQEDVFIGNDRNMNNEWEGLSEKANDIDFRLG